MWNSSEVEVKHDIPSVSPSLPLTDLMPANLRPSGSRNRSVSVCPWSAGTHRGGIWRFSHGHFGGDAEITLPDLMMMMMMMAIFDVDVVGPSFCMGALSFAPSH